MSRPAARLDPPEVREGRARLRLRLADEVREASFDCDSMPLAASADAALVAVLPVAMGLASSLEVAAAPSPTLLENSGTIQALLSTWGPSLQALEVRSRPHGGASAGGERGTAAFFTCGVDSFYTVLRRREEIDAVVYAHGLDLPRDDPKRELVSKAFQEAARELGLPGIELETDLRTFSDPVCDWERIYTSAALASIGHLLSDRFERVLIPPPIPTATSTRPAATRCSTRSTRGTGCGSSTSTRSAG